ncbi:MAG: hypothetical protein ACD_19C00337G0002 [uncultured bacterium]|nr:MAG: hypothetical protein ACD_19C00337G0002 [uncultured bacterium]
MDKNSLLHLALQYQDEDKADLFFTKILGLEIGTKFNVKANFSKVIFGINHDVAVKIYSGKNITFEIFFTNEISKIGYEHICITLNDKQDIIKKCQDYGLEVKTYHRSNRDYLFIKDFAGYLYEIK